MTGSRDRVRSEGKHILELGGALPPDRLSATTLVDCGGGRALVHHSPHINRLFVEDLVAAVRASPFALDVVRAMFPNPAAPEVQAGLEWRYPGRRGGRR